MDECYLDPGLGKPVHVFPMGSRVCQCGEWDLTVRPPEGIYTGRRKRKTPLATEDFDRVDSLPEELDR